MKIALLLFTLCLTLLADTNRYNMIKEFYLSKGNAPYTQILKLENIQDIKAYVGSTLSYKVLLNKEGIGDNVYYFKSIQNASYLISVSIPYEIVDNCIIFKIDKNSPDEVIVKANTPTLQSYLLFDILSEYEYQNIFPMEKFYFALVYGLMFYAFFNSMVFFLFNRQKTFLYYALLQLSLIGFFLNFTYWNLYYPQLVNYLNLVAISTNAIIIFSILFNMEFLRTKKSIPKFHKVLQFALAIVTLNLLLSLIAKESVLFSYNQSYFFFLLLVIAAILVAKKGYVEARYYFLGWSIVLVGVLIAATRSIDLSAIYFIHLIFPFETIMFSFALGYQIIQVQKRALKQEKILMQQSKLVSMGEMVANIAHQWRQPLNNVSSIFMNLKAAQRHDKLSVDLFEKKGQQIDEQLLFMSNTIEDFRNFFMMEKDKKTFNIQEVCKKSYELASLHVKNIEIDFSVHTHDDITITSYENEFSHVVFNLINNSIEALKSRKINNPKITLNIYKKGSWVYITLQDNAEGISKKILDKIFEPYFTTKEKGMGIGLYMSKMMIEEHMKGSLHVKNINKGALFEVKLPCST